MADKTGISWTDRTWNVTTGCSKVSPGCDHCYMFRQWDRLHGMNVRGYEGPADRVALQPQRLEEPQHWRKPQRVFVDSMSDLFHPSVPVEYLCRVFETMAAAKQHTFQILTKRPGRMAWFANEIIANPCEPMPGVTSWPDNVWAGTSLEQMVWGNKLLWKRVELLAQVPARVRFLSAEPLLRPLDLRPWLVCAVCADTWGGARHEADAGTVLECRDILKHRGRLSWVIVGCESGPGARPMNPDWVRDLRDQCQAAGVPFFYKQAVIDGKRVELPELDGRQWKEFPDAGLGGHHV